MRKPPSILAILAALAALLLFSGCGTLAPFFAEPEVRFENMRPASQGMLQSTLHFTFRIYNPNPLAARLDRVSYALTVSGQTVARGRAELNRRIQPAGTRTVVLPVTLHYTDFIAAVPGFVHRDTIPYRITGSFDIMGFDLPFATGGEIQNAGRRLFRGPSLLYCDRCDKQASPEALSNTPQKYTERYGNISFSTDFIPTLVRFRTITFLYYCII